MNKSKRLQFWAICLFIGSFQQNQYASEDDKTIHEKYVLAMTAAGITTAALRLSSHGINQSMNLAKASIVLNNSSTKIYDWQVNFPHTKSWYDNHLAVKYPQADFKKKPFIIGLSNASSLEAVIIDYEDSIKLNDIIKKQSHGKLLSVEELDKISEMELILLHEAAHINNKDIVNSVLLTAGVAGGLELMYQKHKKSQPVHPPSKTWLQATWKLTKSLPKRVAIFGAMATTTGVIESAYSRYYEAQADAFANQHADINALKAGCNRMKDLNQQFSAFEDRQSSIFNTHPSLKSRIQKIEDEIKRREKN